MEFSYLPAVGPDCWRAVAGGSSVALLPAEVSAATADALWRGLGTGTMTSMLHALRKTFGPATAAMPPFILIAVEGEGIRIAVRGPVEVVAAGPRSTENITGHGAETWTERFLPGAHRVIVVIDSELDESAALPLVAGVVQAAAISVSSAPSATSASAVDLTTKGPVSPVDEPPSDEEMVWGVTVALPPRAIRHAPPEPLGDHDGETIAAARLRDDHLGAVHASTHDVPAPRPPRGRIVLSTGQTIEIERTIVIGRRPKSTRSADAELPLLVAVESPEYDISRSHLEVRAEGEHVLVTDLHTTNGTVLSRGGTDPVRLHPGEATMVVTGDVVDIGDGLTLAFEDLP
ncbi:FHA domain-containing protein [Microbacterium sp.]|uniref:FHA domain-containing protein n=1 Tax=Microbacterium sp. TaxID=51671 RepID=UPI003A85FF87